VAQRDPPIKPALLAWDWPSARNPSSFEQVVKALNISPEEYESSLELKEWVRRNKDHKYVPTGLLEAFGFNVNTEP
jgi:hypothetical protein